MAHEKLDIKELIKDNEVHFSYYRAGNLYYTVETEGKTYTFPVPIDDIGDATFWHTDKAIYFMRYIRKAIKEETITQEV